MIRRTLRILTALARAPTPLKEGVAGGVDEQIREVVTQVAKKDGLDVEAIVISGTASPNENDVDAAAIVNNVASEVGLYATRDGIAVERKEHNPYVNIITVRAQDRNAPWVPKLAKAYQSQEVRHFIQTHFNGSVIPAF